MKYVRVTGKPDPERAPEFFRVLAGSSYVTEARLFDLNVSPGGKPTGLFEVDGDEDRVRTELNGSNGVRSVETAPVTDGTFNLLVTLDPSTVALLRDAFGAITQEGMVVAKPVVYRDERVHSRIVGSSSALQAAIGKFPSDIELEIDTIGEFDRRRDSPLSMLSDRQREAVVTAFSLGYYDHPREATHEDLADRMGCAPNTVSDHLQKAEKKIVTALLESRSAR
ncbi:helix-turn-helix domain-containing protein [Halosolutus halophilus]|uniref:helix-turn-helix domain-containing protein n=1 Tax=Halosolutus halophilus TaxID=1552990 RepID=UPI002234FCD6|nr:helix-turn-helix domain-containing protein [Halosolutus halophilus]